MAMRDRSARRCASSEAVEAALGVQSSMPCMLLEVDAPELVRRVMPSSHGPATRRRGRAAPHPTGRATPMPLADRWHARTRPVPAIARGCGSRAGSRCRASARPGSWRRGLLSGVAQRRLVDDSPARRRTRVRPRLRCGIPLDALRLSTRCASAPAAGRVHRRSQLDARLAFPASARRPRCTAICEGRGSCNAAPRPALST